MTLRALLAVGPLILSLAPALEAKEARPLAELEAAFQAVLDGAADSRAELAGRLAGAAERWAAESNASTSQQELARDLATSLRAVASSATHLVDHQDLNTLHGQLEELLGTGLATAASTALDDVLQQEVQGALGAALAAGSTPANRKPVSYRGKTYEWVQRDGRSLLVEAGAKHVRVQAKRRPRGVPGSLDGLDATGLAVGWAADPADPSAAVQVRFSVDRDPGEKGQGGKDRKAGKRRGSRGDLLTGKTLADLPRADVVAAGYPGDHGFRFVIPNAWRDGRRHELYAYVVGKDGPRPLPGSPLRFRLRRVSGDLTLRGSQVTVQTSSTHAGAVTGLTWNGLQMVNNDDHGRQIQVAWTTGQGERFNPTEAGRGDDGARPDTTSVLLAAAAQHPSLSTRCYPAYWASPGTSVNPISNAGASGAAINLAEVAPDVLAKTIEVDALGNPHLLRWETTITLARPTPHVTAEIPTPYLTGAFTSFHTWNPATGALAPLPASPSSATGFFADGAAVGEQPLPVVLATADGSHALGLWSPEPGATYGRFDFRGAFGTAKINAVVRRDGLPAGDQRYVCYLAVGSLQDVAAALAQAHRSGAR